MVCKCLWKAEFTVVHSASLVEFVWCRATDIAIEESKELSARAALTCFNALEGVRGKLPLALISRSVDPQVLEALEDERVAYSQRGHHDARSLRLPTCIRSVHSMAINADHIESTVGLRIGTKAYMANIALRRRGCTWKADHLAVG